MVLYISIIVLLETFFCPFVIVLDRVANDKNWKVLKIKFPLLKTSVRPKWHISRVSFIFQIVNLLYFIIYLTFAFVDSFVYASLFFLLFNLITALSFFIILFISTFVLFFVLQNAHKKEDGFIKGIQEKDVGDL